MEIRENLQRIIDAIPFGIHVINPKGLILEVNRAWLIHFGKTREDVRGKPLKEVMKTMIFFDSGKSRKDNPWEFTDPAALEVLKTRLPATATFHQGQSEAIARPVLDKTGQLVMVVTTYVDRTDGSQKTLEKRTDPGLMLGNSPAVQKLRQMIQRVASTDATVMICGPTGTGKEVAANEIQRLSARAEKPFVKVNCSAIPESLMEAELFGYEKGSFTGALKTGKVGLMESANGGTLLLDEISEMPLSMQPKLLRAIQERAVVRVGGLATLPVDIRIIATSNRDLLQEVKAGRFREDLYYRLNVIPLDLPPLREREGDIRLIAEHFQKYQRNTCLSPGAWAELESYAWPGNVRQLRNHMERMVVLYGGGEISREQMRESLGLREERAALTPRTEEPAVMNLQEATEQLQARLIQAALKEFHTTYRAAEALGISQPTLVRKAKALGISSGNCEERNVGFHPEDGRKT